MKKFNTWNTHTITTTDSNKNFLVDTKVFYDLLVKEHKSHIKQSNDIDNEFREISKIKSPMTIFNGKWGSGKTFFIENFIQNFKTNSNDGYFEEVLYIDALEILENENVILQLLEIISNSDTELGHGVKNAVEKITKNNHLKTFSMFSSLVLNDLFAKITGVDLKNAISESKNNSEDEIDPIEIKKKTIVLIDNLERIGSDAKNILKTTYKLRGLENIYFILVTNVDKLFNAIEISEEAKEEFPIYKFINTSIFDFSQDYSSVFKNHISTISDDEVKIINTCLNNTTDGEQMSIREFSNWAKEFNFWDLNNKFDRFKGLSKIENINILDQVNKEYKDLILKQKKNLLEIYNEARDIVINLSNFINNQSDSSFFESGESFIFNKNITNELYNLVNMEKTAYNINEFLEFIDKFNTLVNDEFSHIVEQVNHYELVKAKEEDELNLFLDERGLLKEKRLEIESTMETAFKERLDSLTKEYNIAENNRDIDLMDDLKIKIKNANKLAETIGDTEEIKEIDSKLNEIEDRIKTAKDNLKEIEKSKSEAVSRRTLLLTSDANGDEGLIVVGTDELLVKLKNSEIDVEELDIIKNYKHSHLDEDDNKFAASILSSIFNF